MKTYVHIEPRYFDVMHACMHVRKLVARGHSVKPVASCKAIDDQGSTQAGAHYSMCMVQGAGGLGAGCLQLRHPKFDLVQQGTYVHIEPRYLDVKHSSELMCTTQCQLALGWCALLDVHGSDWRWPGTDTQQVSSPAHPDFEPCATGGWAHSAS